MHTTPLHDRFGVQVHGADLTAVTRDSGFAPIRDLFERHSVLYFAGQNLGEDEQIRFASLFGPIEDRSGGANGPRPVISPVTNLGVEGDVIPESENHVLNLKANQLWHTDSTFLPVPALANVLAAKTVSSVGGETQFVSTRAAWRDLDDGLKQQVSHGVLWHRYAHSRARISRELATDDLFTKWPDQAWNFLWRNPVTGEDALYLASHAFAIEGMDESLGSALIDRLMDHATQAKYIYTHSWRPGDVIVWDERATMHRGQPWPYEEERTLLSVCVSAGERDGLNSVRPSWKAQPGKANAFPDGAG